MVGGRFGWAVLVIVTVGALGCGGASRSGTTASRAALTAAVPGGAITTVPLRDFGTDVVVGTGGRVYVTVPSGRVIAVDTTTKTVAGEIVVDGEPYALAVTPDGRRLYVADLRGEEVVVVDTAAAKVTTRIPIGTMRRPSLRPSVAVSRDGLRVYLGDTSRDNLVVIATDADQVRKDMFLDFHPADVAFAPDGTVWVAGCKLACVDGTLLAVDSRTNEIVRRIKLDSPPSGLVVTPDGRRAYVANGREASVSVVELTTESVSTIAVDPEPVGIAISPGGRRVYVTSFRSGTLSAIDTASGEIVARIPVGKTPRAVALSADGTHAYVTHSTTQLSIIDFAAGQ